MKEAREERMVRAANRDLLDALEGLEGAITALKWTGREDVMRDVRAALSYTEAAMEALK